MPGSTAGSELPKIGPLPVHVFFTPAEPGDEFAQRSSQGAELLVRQRVFDPSVDPFADRLVTVSDVPGRNRGEGLPSQQWNLLLKQDGQL